MQANLTTTAVQAEEPEKDALRIGIQGYAGAFHEIAARQFFAEQPLAIVPAHTFSDLVAAIEAGETTDAGLMAIENTLAGSLMANYRLLMESELVVTGEVFLRIQQNLMVLPGVKMEDLREVHSHPVAIAQCRPYFQQYPHIQLIESVDTALSARDIQEKGAKQQGAIASSLAANLYDLDILAEGIETNKHNHTRFLVLERRSEHRFLAEANKISICFSTDHAVGSLYKVLAILAAYNVNLSKIQSAPIIGKPWEYRFFVDFELQGEMGWEQAVDAIRPITKELHLLGAYTAGEKSSLALPTF